MNNQKQESFYQKTIKFKKKNQQKKYLTVDDTIDDAVGLDLISDAALSESKKIISTISIFILIFMVWAYFFSIDEVSKGSGKIVPSSKEQTIQSLDGGILDEINVKEGDIVESGQVLVQLDTTRTSSNMEETLAKYHASLATQARLKAEVNQTDLKFSKKLDDFPELIESESRLFKSRKQRFGAALRNINESRKLIKEELTINSQLLTQGATSSVDVIKLKRQLLELQMKENEIQSEYFVRSREELAKVNSDVESLAPVVAGRTDLINKSTIKSPVRGVVKSILIPTIGGVIPPNGSIMTIVPLDDTLLVETRISPRDIAFMHPGQKARVKITAYDYSIYGQLDGKVDLISPDTVKDEIQPGVAYYKIYIKTNKDYVENKNHKKFFITPGMIASVDIKTGSKTIAQYLIKPFNKVNEALRER